MANPIRQRALRIYLTGFMASGKSTIGPILANTIGYSCADLDRLIEQRTGKSVTEIFRADGEECFRRLELEMLREVSARDRYVVSLGGGTVLQEANLAVIHETGILVYLRAGTEQLMRRLRHKTDRPVLRTPAGDPLSDEALRERIDQLLSSRSATYNQADFIIDTDNSTVGNTVDRIVRLLAPYIK